MSYLELKQISKNFGSFQALKDISFSVEAGEFVSFLGASGCGKTTTLRIIAGFEQESSGVVTLAGSNLAGVSPEKRNLGFVFQQYALFPNMTVRRNVAFGLKGIGLNKAQIESRVDEYLDQVRLTEFGQRYPHELSGGQQQRVSLARALARQPKMLLLDEPLSALDAKIRVHLRAEIKAIQKRLGITTLYVTHDQEEALWLSDRIVLMNQGVIEQIGTPTQLYNSPASEYVASFIGTINSLTARVLNVNDGTVQYGANIFQLPTSLLDNANRDIQILLRPEKITLQSNDTSKVSAKGVVTDRSFLGSVVRFVITPAGMSKDHSVQVDVFNIGHSLRHQSLPEIGAQVEFQFSPEDCVIY